MKEHAWKKLGLIYRVNNKHPSLITHASNPLAMHLFDDTFRIFYSGRNKQNKSSVSFVDYDILQQKVIYDHKKPIIEPKDNTFYSHGITIGNCWKEKDDTYIGFMGWQQKEGQHWRGDIGKFNLRSGDVSLLLGTNPEDQISLSYPHIEICDKIYKMWYGSTISWSSPNGEMIHVIKYAESKDCKKWCYKGVAIPYKLGEAQAFSKPSVFLGKDIYQMWYSYRGGNNIPYRIGYSYSNNGKDWNRDQSNLDVSKSGWDSEMVCYPHVFRHKKRLYMLYNGNKYGIEGFGLAVCKVGDLVET